MDEHSQLFNQVVQIVADVADADPEHEARQILDTSCEDGNLDRQKALAIAEKRASGVPLALLTGYTSFMGLRLHFEPGVFVVRPETELLGRTAVRVLEGLAQQAANGSKLSVIDIGCGSGNLTCGIATSLSSVTAFATDLSEQCVALTSKNAILHGIESRVHIVQGDMFAALGDLGLEGSTDLIVSNPPYIASERLRNDRAFLVAHEPVEAFDGGPFGITFQQRLIRESAPFLKPGGYLLFEFGVGQHRQIQRLFERSGAYRSITFERNEAGEERVAVGRRH